MKKSILHTSYISTLKGARKIMKNKILVYRTIAIAVASFLFLLGVSHIGQYRDIALEVWLITLGITVALHSVWLISTAGDTFLYRRVRLSMSKRMVKGAFRSGCEPSTPLILGIQFVLLGIIAVKNVPSVPQPDYGILLFTCYLIVLIGIGLYIFEDLPTAPKIYPETRIKTTEDEPTFWDNDITMYPHTLASALRELVEVTLYPFIFCIDILVSVIFLLGEMVTDMAETVHYIFTRLFKKTEKK